MKSCRIDKPWGFEDIKVHTPFYVVKLLNVTPGHGTSVQYHAVKDEALTLSSGEISILLYHGSIDEEPERIHLLQGEWGQDTSRHGPQDRIDRRRCGAGGFDT